MKDDLKLSDSVTLKRFAKIVSADYTHLSARHGHIFEKGACIEAWIKAYCGKLSGMASGRAGASGELDPSDERARLTHHQANMAGIDEEEKKGNLVKVDEIAGVWSQIGFNIKTKLRALPDKVSHQVLACENVKEVKGLLDAEVEIILEELSAGDTVREIDESALTRVEAPSPAKD